MIPGKSIARVYTALILLRFFNHVILYESRLYLLHPSHSLTLLFLLLFLLLLLLINRMWCAMGECYERLHRPADAIKCFMRAEGNQDREGIALPKLARLHLRLKNVHAAAEYFEKVRFCCCRNICLL